MMKYLSLGHCGNEEMVFKYDEKRRIQGRVQRSIDGTIIPLSNLDEEGCRAELLFRENIDGSRSNFELWINSTKSIVLDLENELIILGNCGSVGVGFKYNNSKFYLDKEEDARSFTLVGRMVCISDLKKKGCLAVFTAIAAYDSRWDRFELYIYPTNVKEVTKDN